MATNRWTGDAAATAQVTHVTPSAVEQGDIFTLICNRKSISVTATDNTIASLIIALVNAITAAGQTIPEWAEITAGAGVDGENAAAYLILTGPDDGTTFTVTSSTTNNTVFTIICETIQFGSNGKNQIQRLKLNGPPTSGNFTMTFAGQTSANTAFSASAATLQTNLEALTTVGAANTSVSKLADGDWTIEFTSALANTSQPLILVNNVSLDGGTSVVITQVKQGRAASYAKGPVLTLDLSAGSVQFQFDFIGGGGAAGLHYLSDIVYNLSHLVPSVQIRNALESILVPATLVGETATADAQPAFVQAITACDVVGPDGGPFTITIRDGVPSITNSDCLAVANSFSALNVPGADPTLSLAAAASLAGISEIQTVNIFGGPTGGTFTLNFEGQTTGGIGFNAQGYDVRDALIALSNIGGVAEVQTLTITGGPAGGTVTLRWNGNNTSAIAYNAIAGAVEAALDTAVQLSSPNGTVACTGGPWPGSAITVTFRQAVGVGNQPAITLQTNGLTGGASPGLTVATTTDGAVSDVLVTAADGTEVGFGAPFTVTFQNNLQFRDCKIFTADATGLTGGSGVAEILQNPTGVLPQIQHLLITGKPTGGTFTLTSDWGAGSETTAAIAYNASAATVQGKLEGTAGLVPGQVFCSGGPLPVNPVLIRYVNGFTAIDPTSASSLTCSNTQALVVGANTVNPTGPFHVDNANNWTLGVPVNGQDILITGDRPMKFGLTALAAVVPNSLTIEADFTGTIGLEYDNGGYLQYRQRKLQIGGAGAFNVYIGTGEGSGSTLVGIDFMTANVKVVAQKSGSPQGERPAVLLLLNNASAEVNVMRGSVGIAFDAGETSSVARVRESYIGTKDSDSWIVLGVGATIPIVEKYAGSMECRASISTSFLNIDGDVDFLGSATMAQLYIRGGEFKYRSNGTLGGATIVSGEGLLNFDGDARTKIVTNPIDVYGDSADVTDTFKVATTNGESPAALVIDYNETTRNKNLGSNYRLKRLATA